MQNLRPILLLEDDFVDAMMVKRAMKDIGVKNPLIRVIDGEEGLAYLRDNKNPRPCIIILDLNMPRMNGLEFLKIAKKDNQLKTIPVIVLTTSRADQDKYECFSCSVAGYIVKSIRYEDFMNAMRILDLYWSINELSNDDVGDGHSSIQHLGPGLKSL